MAAKKKTSKAPSGAKSRAIDLVPRFYKGDTESVIITKRARVGGAPVNVGDLVKVSRGDAIVLRMCNCADPKAAKAEVMNASNTESIVNEF